MAVNTPVLVPSGDKPLEFRRKFFDHGKKPMPLRASIVVRFDFAQLGLSSGAENGSRHLACGGYPIRRADHQAGERCPAHAGTHPRIDAVVERRKVLNHRRAGDTFHPPPDILYADVDHPMTKRAYAVARHTRRNFAIDVKNLRNVRDLAFPRETGPQFVILGRLAGGVRGIHAYRMHGRLS